MPTETTLAGPNSQGTVTELGPQSTPVTSIPIQAYSVSDARVDPVTSGALSGNPSTGLLLILVDTTPRAYGWFYNPTADTWNGFQLGATP